MSTGTAPLTSRLADEIAALDREIDEIDLLVTQATAEASRHEQRRAAASEKVDGLKVTNAAPEELLEATGQLVILTKRAAVMEAQVEVLEGKRKALARFRDAARGYAAMADGAVEPSGAADGAGETDDAGDAASPADVEDVGETSPARSRVAMRAQEDLRRQIARAMHDGPAQSLTNIVLQAQIVERILTREPAAAAGEVKLLIGMVQQTLDATKSFIFDIRPMVLDDLGLVPTLRRMTAERGRRSGVGVQFESLGSDRRLPVDVESALFRILDDGLAGYLAAGAERARLALDWTEELAVDLVTGRGPVESLDAPGGEEPTDSGMRSRGRRLIGRSSEEEEVPPALAAMLEEQSEAEDAAARAARSVELPPAVWQEISQRATTIGATIELVAEGAGFALVLPLHDEAAASEAAEPE
jgi:two-component system sensor histidine kinase DegS